MWPASRGSAASPTKFASSRPDQRAHYKCGYGFNPLLVSCGREVLARVLRPGNAGANNAEDHLALLDLALEQLPQGVLDGEILARSDSAGASHDLADACRETAICFSFGYPLTDPVRQALEGLAQIGVASGGRSGRTTPRRGVGGGADRAGQPRRLA